MPAKIRLTDYLSHGKGGQPDRQPNKARYTALQNPAVFSICERWTVGPSDQLTGKMMDQQIDSLMKQRHGPPEQRTNGQMDHEATWRVACVRLKSQNETS